MNLRYVIQQDVRDQMEALGEELRNREIQNLRNSEIESQIQQAYESRARRVSYTRVKNQARRAFLKEFRS